MAQRPNATILHHFTDLDHPRVARTRRHNLVDILAIAICSTICGADSCREDQCRVRKDNRPQNINTLPQIGHNLLKNETTLQVGIQGKRLNPGWDENYLLKVLLG